MSLESFKEIRPERLSDLAREFVTEPAGKQLQFTFLQGKERSHWGPDQSKKCAVTGLSVLQGRDCGVHPGGVAAPGPCSEGPLQRCDAGELQLPRLRGKQQTLTSHSCGGWMSRIMAPVGSMCCGDPLLGFQAANFSLCADKGITV
nr:PREDICTED: uncharacterized protein LOC109439483 isoform X1 [Rhinolophus sinicus]XP_019575357.1 PREDICTED: uncharacterized protein LOC109439483 isoform X1 [Rhinolophus sinicus]XP_019575358.1 PREDICTED: uncharacterized protein LOC109439483 isoform X1 [Rhinolophus sinicus]